MSNQDKDALLAEAEKLGLNVPGNIGIPKLIERIEEAKAKEVEKAQDDEKAEVQGQGTSNAPDDSGNDQANPGSPEDATEQDKDAKVEPIEGTAFVYVGPLDKTECFGTQFVKGEPSVVASELGVKKLSNHPHFEKK